MSKIKNGGLDQYDAKPCEQQQFGTTVVEGVNHVACDRTMSYWPCTLTYKSGVVVICIQVPTDIKSHGILLMVKEK